MSEVDPIYWDAGDRHHWERPTSPPCQDCECCTARLCAVAIEKGTACHFEGGSGDFDLSRCPCWRPNSPARARAAEGDCARCPHPPHHAGMCEAPAADDDESTCGREETT